MNYLRILGFEDGFLGHTWSLSVEEHFYLVWPFLFLLICALSRTFRVPRVSLLVIVLAVLAVLSISWRTYLTLNGHQYTAYNDTFARAAGFFIGGLATFTLPLYRRWVSRGFSHVLGIVGFSAVALYLFTGKIMSPIADLWLVPVLSALLVLWSARVDDSRSLRIFAWAPVNYIGKISYGVYLWHFPLIVMLPEMLPKYRFVAVTIVSILIATLSYHLMEKPLSQKLRACVTV